MSHNPSLENQACLGKEGIDESSGPGCFSEAVHGRESGTVSGIQPRPRSDGNQLSLHRGKVVHRNGEEVVEGGCSGKESTEPRFGECRRGRPV